MINSRSGRKQDGELISMDACTHCDSSDAMAVYLQPNTSPPRHSAYCFSCTKYEPNPPGYLGMSHKTESSTAGSNESDALVTSTYAGSSVGILSKAHVSQHTPPVASSLPTLEDVLSEFKT